jgi:hypothetical protein
MSKKVTNKRGKAVLKKRFTSTQYSFHTIYCKYKRCLIKIKIIIYSGFNLLMQLYYSKKLFLISGESENFYAIPGKKKVTR